MRTRLHPALTPALLALLALAGCGRGDHGGGGEPATVAQDAAQGRAEPAPELAHRYSYRFRLPDAAVAPAQQRHIAMCAGLGLARCRMVETHGSAYGPNSGGSTTFEVARAIAPRFGEALSAPVRALGGTLTSSDVAAEDLARQIVDGEARVRAKELLVRRLTAMLATRNGPVADLVATEKAVADVQEELDAARSRLAQARDRVATSPFEVSYDGVAGFGSQVGTALGAVGATFTSSVVALIYVLSAAVPWLALLAVLLFASGVLRRRLRTRRAPAAAPPPA